MYSDAIGAAGFSACSRRSAARARQREINKEGNAATARAAQGARLADAGEVTDPSPLPASRH